VAGLLLRSGPLARHGSGPDPAAAEQASVPARS